MIADLLPPPIETAESCGDPDTPPDMFPEEAALVARAVDERRREFATVRACARSALGRLGVPPTPLLPGERGAPRWPSGIVGSMTHCRGYRAAAVARASDVAAIGIDAEPNLPMPSDGTLHLVTLAEERAMVRELAAARPYVHWDRLLFSAKESVYKAWFPLTGRWLDFDEALIEVAPAAGTFCARLPAHGPSVHGTRMTGFAGRWLVRQDRILTAVVLPATGPGHVSREPSPRS